MRKKAFLRGILSLAATLTVATAGVLAVAGTASAATPTLTVAPSTGLQPTGSTAVTVSGSGYAASSLGGISECNSASGQPTIEVAGNAVPVSCSNPLNAITTTSGSGDLGPYPFTVTTGTVGPPATGTDSSGGDAATDAAKYPCPPTTAQQAAGDTCNRTSATRRGTRSPRPSLRRALCRPRRGKWLRHGCRGRRRLLVWDPPLLRLCRWDEAQQASRWNGPDAQRRRLLAGRL